MLTRLRIKLPSPALVIACLALFVALSGTAVAAAIVPLAKRALSADTLKGKTPAALVREAAQLPGPASSAGGVFSTKTQGDSLGADTYRELMVACDSGRKAVGGGFWSDGPVVDMGSRPVGDTTWQLGLYNLSTTRAATLTLHVVCVA
jgi:hypothetical protein